MTTADLSPKALTAWRNAAGRIGVDPAEYVRRRLAGQRWRSVGAGARGLVYRAAPAERCDRVFATALTAVAARLAVADLNAASMRGWRPGQPQPTLYYAVPAATEEVRSG